MRLNRVILIFILAFSLRPAGAAVYIVDGSNPAAKDDNPGTPEAPFRSIQAGVAAARKAGDSPAAPAGQTGAREPATDPTAAVRERARAALAQLSRSVGAVAGQADGSRLAAPVSPAGRDDQNGAGRPTLRGDATPLERLLAGQQLNGEQFALAQTRTSDADGEGSGPGADTRIAPPDQGRLACRSPPMKVRAGRR